jgi:S-formylglutathione hydrolase FrmB
VSRDVVRTRIFALLPAGFDRGMTYAGTFRAAASFSGVLDTRGATGARGRFVRLFVSAGSGPARRRDPLGGPATLLVRILGRQSATFVARLRRERIAVAVDLGQRGTHTWRYRQRALHGSRPLLMAAPGTR